MAKLAEFLSNPDQAMLVAGTDQFFDSLGDQPSIIDAGMRLTVSNAFQKRGEWEASNRVLKPIVSLADSEVPKWMTGAAELHAAFNMAELNDFEAAKTHLVDASKLLKGTAIADRVQDFTNRLIESGKLTPELQMVALSLSDEVSKPFPRTTGNPAEPIRPLNPPKPTHA